MGLFSKKEKNAVYDAADCERKKKRMREIFDEAVMDGESYDLLYAYMTTSKFEKGFLFDTNTTSFYYYIVGYRTSDDQILLVQVDHDLKEYSEAYRIDMDKIVNVSYDPKICQLCLEYEKGYGTFGELLKIKGTDANTKFGPKNIQQKEERERFLDFAEHLRDVLKDKGYRLDKWKR